MWIEIKTRPLTEEEKEHYLELGHDEDDLHDMYDCQLPECDQEVLVTDRYGNVGIDTFVIDGNDGCYFEDNCCEDDVIAWMPLPEPYQKGEAE